MRREASEASRSPAGDATQIRNKVKITVGSATPSAEAKVEEAGGSVAASSA